MTAAGSGRAWLYGLAGMVLLCGAIVLGDYVVGRTLRSESRCVVTEQSPDYPLVPAGSSALEGSDPCRPCDIRERSVEFVLLPDRYSSEIVACPSP